MRDSRRDANFALDLRCWGVCTLDALTCEFRSCMGVNTILESMGSERKGENVGGMAM